MTGFRGLFVITEINIQLLSLSENLNKCFSNILFCWIFLFQNMVRYWFEPLNLMGHDYDSWSWRHHFSDEQRCPKKQKLSLVEFRIFLFLKQIMSRPNYWIQEIANDLKKGLCLFGNSNVFLMLHIFRIVNSASILKTVKCVFPWLGSNPHNLTNETSFKKLNTYSHTILILYLIRKINFLSLFWACGFFSLRRHNFSKNQIWAFF